MLYLQKANIFDALDRKIIIWKSARMQKCYIYFVTLDPLAASLVLTDTVNTVKVSNNNSIPNRYQHPKEIQCFDELYVGKKITCIVKFKCKLLLTHNSLQIICKLETNLKGACRCLHNAPFWTFLLTVASAFTFDSFW